MNKTKTIYWAKKDEITELTFVVDYPGKVETSIWKTPLGSLIEFQNEEFELKKHLYFEDKKQAMEQVIKWHKDRITIMEHNIKNQ